MIYEKKVSLFLIENCTHSLNSHEIIRNFSVIPKFILKAFNLMYVLNFAPMALLIIPIHFFVKYTFKLLDQPKEKVLSDSGQCFTFFHILNGFLIGREENGDNVEKLGCTNWWLIYCPTFCFWFTTKKFRHKWWGGMDGTQIRWLLVF